MSARHLFHRHRETVIEHRNCQSFPEILEFPARFRHRLSPISRSNASSSFSFQLATVKLYVENQIILNINNFDSFSDQQLSCDPLFGTERRTTACARPRILIGQRNCQLSQKLGPSPDNEGLNIKNCILAARTLNVPLFYGDT